MKKISIFVFVLALSLNTVIARDYTKLQLKELKHAQKYGTTKNVVQNTTLNNVFETANLQLKDPHIMKFGNYDIISKDKYDAKIKKSPQKLQTFFHFFKLF